MKNDIIRARLCEAVKISGLSRGEIAKRADVSGTTVRRYMNGETYPSLKMLVKLCDILDVTADYLLGMTEY